MEDLEIHFHIRNGRDNMSKRILKHKEFLHLLLNSTKDQARALLYTITPEQVSAISEIVLNLLELPLPNTVKTILQRRRKVFKKISDKMLSVRTRTSLIKKHMTLMLSTLHLVKSQLQEVII